MPEPIHFTILGIPVPKGRPRAARIGNFVRMYTPKKTAEAEETIKTAARDALKMPLVGPVRLSVRFYMRVPTSLSKKRRQALYGKFHTKRPDLDNLLKTVLDGLNQVAFYDDSQIAEISATKIYADPPRTEITVEEI